MLNGGALPGAPFIFLAALGLGETVAGLRPVKESWPATISVVEDAGRPWWLWLHVLSLDAALVALVAQEAFAWSAGATLSGVERGVLALCAWLAYCGDRLLDARRLKGPVDSARHEFARMHANPLSVAWGLGLLGALVLAGQLPRTALLAGGALAVGVGGYFFLQHHQKMRALAGRGKELMAGVGFAAGTLFFVLMKAPFSMPLALLGIAWACICSLNCLLIAGWDRARDRAMGQHSLAGQWPGMETALPRLAMAPLALAGAAPVLEVALLPLAVALAGSALALLELARRAPEMDPELRRVWADAVLLTPVLILW